MFAVWVAVVPAPEEKGADLPEVQEPVLGRTEKRRQVMGKKVSSAYLGMMSAFMMGGMGGGMPGTRIRAEKPQRPCLHCGTPHSHKNSFCSADCCKLWKVKKKEKGGK